MPLFEFDLFPVEEIIPWGLPDNPNLSWFALTDGSFRMPVNDQLLFRYTPEAVAHFQFPDRLDADYQIASIARDILGSVAAGIALLPPFFERIASEQEFLKRLSSATIEENPEDDSDPQYDAWRWLGERSPWTGYFVDCPDFHFLRIGDRIHLRWDNRGKHIDGYERWAASHGSLDLPVEDFVSECRDFANRLLAAMEERISRIETGQAHPQTTVSIESLREQHEDWREEFDAYFHPKPPEIPWDEVETAVRKIAAASGIPLPE